MKSSRNSTQIAVEQSSNKSLLTSQSGQWSALIYQRLPSSSSIRARVPLFPCKQGTSISHHDSFPGRAAAVYCNPQQQNDPHPLSVSVLQRCWLGNCPSGLKSGKGRGKLGSWGGCNSKQTERKEMPSPRSLLWDAGTLEKSCSKGELPDGFSSGNLPADFLAPVICS